ncbi:MAG TPA: ACP S-malonyltransferase [Methyloceanibacter sp.]|jgi:[acyl-carrier-protein] S-malonyltransferase|nr:ACP S-malonyltransferase [Methyloceanibacter sp.]
MSIAFVFPGQGSQAVGMGAELAKAYAPARAVFAEVDEALGQSLSTLIWVGPEDQLTLTENAQPALMAVSLAVIRVLEAEKGLSLKESVAFVAGHSLGEYSALAAAGSLSLADTARLLKTRGQAMQAAVPVGEGAMAALLGADLSQAQELAKAASEGEVCSAANDNAPGQVVISGTRTAIERTVALAPKFGARRAVLLPVSAPFHCALMRPAAQVMQEALSEVKISAPSMPLVANVLASAISDPEAIRSRLIEQVTGMVRWRESILYLRDQGVDSLYEIGAGRVLTGLARRFEGFEARSVGTPEELEAAATALQARDA